MGNLKVKVVPLCNKNQENIIVNEKYVGTESIDSKVAEFIAACYKLKSQKRNTLYLLKSKNK